MKYQVIIYDNENNCIIEERTIEAEELYEAAKFADEIYRELNITAKDTSMKLVEKDA